MDLLRACALWIVSHPTTTIEYLLAVGVVVSSAVGLLPAAAQQRPWTGWIVRWFYWMGALTHRDQPGTFKWPFYATKALEAAEKASHPSKNPPDPDQTPTDLGKS